jgi:hypothetical protein
MCELLASNMRRGIALVLLLSSASALHAQSTFASLSGRVTDPSHAVIVDATITAISADTNIRHVTTTNAAGEYYLANLPPRPYRIEAEKIGSGHWSNPTSSCRSRTPFNSISR